MKKLGVLITDLQPTQQSYITIKALNYVVETTDIDCTIFAEYSRFRPIIEPRFSVMDMTEMWSFDGVLISTNLSNTKLMNDALNSATKAFYIWDLEWLRHKKDFIQNLAIYQSPKISLIARSVDHARIIQNYTNMVPKLIAPQFNIGIILNEYFKN